MKAKRIKGTVGARIIQGLEEFVDALEKKETISERFTCHTIELDLKPTPYLPRMVKENRALLGASQAVFAKLLGVSVRAVCHWEQGLKSPSDIACRFMDEIRRNPFYWINRLRESAV